MRKTLVLAVREFHAAVRTKTFVISLGLMPLMGSAGLIVAFLLKDEVNLDDRRYAIIDWTGDYYDELADAADAHNQRSIFADDGIEQIKPRVRLEQVETDSPNTLALQGRLSDRVRKGDLFGFAEIGTGQSASAESDELLTTVKYHTNNPMNRDFPHWLGRQVNEIAREQRAQAEGLSLEVAKRLTKPVSIDEKPLYVSVAGGGVRLAEETDHYVSVLAAMGLAVLMFLIIFVGAIPLTYSVLEEKMQRSAEVLLGCVTPFQFMMGKILGMVGVSVTIMTIYIVIGFCVAAVNGYAHLMPSALINWFLLYQAGAVLMFGSLYAAIGAACNDMKDAQNLMAPASLVACVPLFVIRPVILEPNSTFSTLISFFPPATPMLMILRQGLPGSIPVWQPILGIIIVLCTALCCVFLASRVFRVGILMNGKGANVKELLQWAFYGVGHRPARPERRKNAEAA